MPYNGHKNWNVSLWINNDESLYRMARHFRGEFTTARYAARVMLRHLPEKNAGWRALLYQRNYCRDAGDFEMIECV